METKESINGNATDVGGAAENRAPGVYWAGEVERFVRSGALFAPDDRSLDLGVLLNVEAIRRASASFAPEDTDVLFFHGNCFDGVTAGATVIEAVQASRPGKEVAAFALYHGYPPNAKRMRHFREVCDSKNVAFVDASLSFEQMESLAPITKNLVLLDHHKTNARMFADQSYACIDTDYAGAVLTKAWEIRSKLLGGDVGGPVARDADCPSWAAYMDPLSSYVGDRDTWKFILPKSREINAGFGVYLGRAKIENVLRVRKEIRAKGAVKFFGDLLEQGEYTLATYEHLISGMARNAATEMWLNIDPETGERSTVRVACINATTLGSETADYLLCRGSNGCYEKNDLVIFWWYEGSAKTKLADGTEVRGRTGLSFRSRTRSDGRVVDVAALGASFSKDGKGGGHVKAAGAKAILGPPVDVFTLVREHIKEHPLVLVTDEEA